MKNLFLTFIATAILLLVLGNTQAQVKIGRNPGSLDTTAALQIGDSGMQKGLLMPRVPLVSTISYMPLSNGAHHEGMHVYNIFDAVAKGTGDVYPGEYYDDGSKWVRLADAGSTGGGTSPWDVIGSTTTATANNQDIYQSGKVGIGASYSSNPANITSTLEVDGAVTNKASSSSANTTIDFTTSNLAYTSASVGAFGISGMKDGGTYTLAVEGTTSGTATFTQTSPSSITFYYVNNGATAAAQRTLYTFIVIHGAAYVWMTPGFHNP
jgi:hypothetical protein